MCVHGAAGSQATRIEAPINKKDASQCTFWQGLGFEVADGLAALDVDIAAHPQPVASLPESAPPPAAPAAAPPSAAAGKKRGRPTNAERAARAAGGMPAAMPAAAADSQPRMDFAQPLPPVMPQPPVRAQQPPAHAPAPPPAEANGVAAGALPPEANLNEADEGDVYIRKSCPGVGEAHLIVVEKGYKPRDLTTWQHVVESELELSHTVQCLSCRQVFRVERDEAVDVLADGLSIELVPGEPSASALSSAEPVPVS